MDWLSGLNQALDNMESNLQGEINFEHAAKLACCSGFHFQRMFSYIAGVPLGEYIRRRRMTKAAFDLQNSTDKIIDIALRYGYDSPTAFNRAFQSIHGVSPSAARQEGVSLKSYQPISFKITIRGETEMNYKIITKEAFRVVGRKLSVPYTEDHMEAFTKIPAFWGEVKARGDIETLCGLMEGEPEGVWACARETLRSTACLTTILRWQAASPHPKAMKHMKFRHAHGRFLNA